MRQETQPHIENERGNKPPAEQTSMAGHVCDRESGHNTCIVVTDKSSAISASAKSPRHDVTRKRSE